MSTDEEFLCATVTSPVDGHKYHVATVYVHTRTVYLHPDVPAFLTTGFRKYAEEEVADYRFVNDFPPEEIFLGNTSERPS